MSLFGEYLDKDDADTDVISMEENGVNPYKEDDEQW